MSMTQTDQSVMSTPLVVDLDGTLLRTDTLYECFATNFFKHPIRTITASLSILNGRAKLKEKLADIGLPEIAHMPVNEKFVAYLEGQKAGGRPIHLATAADHRIAEYAGQRFSFFDSVTGSKNGTNLKSKNKLQELQNRFPEGFAYAGDSPADLSIWQEARSAILVSTPQSIRNQVKKSSTQIEAEFPKETESGFKTWRRALRVHQWSKNVLLFAPLVLAQLYTDFSEVLNVIMAFFVLGIAASGTYILNDLSDLASDRQHKTKWKRPFAAGTIPVRDGLLVAPVMIFLALIAAFLLAPGFGFLLVSYLATTLAYSFGLKRVAMLDVFILGFLYTLRVLMGVAILGVVLSPWLVSFSFFFFYAMSLAKRHVEIMNAQGQPANEPLKGRGYQPADWPLTLSLGIAATIASIVVVVLYLTEEAFPSGAYPTAEWLWSVPALILLWTKRIWLLSHRGELDDDPVAFAIKDRASLGLGAMLVVFLGLATFT